LTFQLVKGPTNSSTDQKGKNELQFPRIAKFTESVLKPDFSPNGIWKDGNFYDEDIPKAKVSGLAEKEKLLNECVI